MLATLEGGVRCSKRLHILKPLLKEWISTNVDIVGAWAGAGDFPWWYGERASISVLAGAAWKTGSFAFEEFGDDKKCEKKLQPLYHGRVDLYLYVRGEHFIAETKYCQSSATFESPSTTQKLRTGLQEACEDVDKCQRHGQRKLGILFATPYIAKSQKPRADELLNTWFTAMRSVRCSCSAWVFPELRCDWVQDIWPGAAVLIKEV